MKILRLASNRIEKEFKQTTITIGFLVRLIPTSNRKRTLNNKEPDMQNLFYATNKVIFVPRISLLILPPHRSGTIGETFYRGPALFG